ncbi:hypothetical protein AHAS_Ahas04G0130200 [Arachis hypogaea]
MKVIKPIFIVCTKQDSKPVRSWGSLHILSGGYQNMHLIKKDVYIDNVCRSRIIQGNVTASISYLKGKTEVDPLAVVMSRKPPWSYVLVGRGDADEKIPSYKWLLGTFLEVMYQKQPKVVVIDRDKSMKETIRTEFSNAMHQLCTWHLAQNAVSNIKDNDFYAAFKTAVCGHFEVEEFDQYWADMVVAFGLEENEWIWATYEKRSSNCLLELLENLECVVKDYRNNEFIADYKSLYSEPVMTTGVDSIERAMSQIYTREILFENSIGIPCKHINCVLKLLKKDALPMRLVLKRWCKDAKFGLFHDSDRVLDSNRAFQGRYGSLWTSRLPMCLLVAQRPATYEYDAANIAQLLKEIEAEVLKDNTSTFMHDTADGYDILDPNIIKSKGTPQSTRNGKMGRWYRRCHGFGHDRRNCTANKVHILDEVSAKFEVVNFVNVSATGCEFTISFLHY